MKALKCWPIYIAAMLAAGCTGDAPPGEQSNDAPLTAEASSEIRDELLKACHITMAQPERHEWTTYWDPRGIRLAGEGPSWAHSAHWAEEKDQQTLASSGVPLPFEFACSSDPASGGDPTLPLITVSVTSLASSLEHIPFGPGTYPIVSKQSGASAPGTLSVAFLFFDESMFEAGEGTVEIERFDTKGVAGSFKIKGKEIVMGNRPIEIEGTFDIPCRGGLLEGNCQANKAISQGSE